MFEQSDVITPERDTFTPEELIAAAKEYDENTQVS
jgi:hypothetical protein